jgi:flagellar motor protein MotB
MTPHSTRQIAVLAALLFCALSIVPAVAQDLSTADIVKALRPKAKVRALDLEQMARESRQNDVVNRLQREKTRGITIEEKDEIAAVIEENDLPAIDLEVFFASNSADITPEALPVLERLGAALSDEQLKGSVFLVAGHIDAKEAGDNDLGLSEQRAKAVRGFLIDKFSIDPERLVAVGFGEEQLKNKDDPRAAENRRVQVVNLASQKTAKAGEEAE